MSRQVEGGFITDTVYYKKVLKEYHSKMCSELLCPQLLHIVAAGICNFKFRTSLQNFVHGVPNCWVLVV
jgi:hypothetical protein